jgi:hypothetical protein
MSSVSKIIIQMNAKVGAVPWLVAKTDPYFRNKSMMYGGLSICNGEKGSTITFVGTTNDESSQVFSDCKTEIHDK